MNWFRLGYVYVNPVASSRRAPGRDGKPALTVSLEGTGETERFRELVKEWREATLFTSSITEMSTHPAYQQIIGMGEKAIPLILEELRKEPGHWFWALRAITGANPVPPAHRGDLEAMTRDWLDWAQNHSY